MKKIICLILTLTIIISSFSAFASEYLPLYEDMDSVFRFDVGEFVEDAGEGEIVETPAMKRMGLLENLGIWDDAGKGENDLVTLTEFSVIMSRLKLGAGNALEGVYEVNESSENATYRNAYAYLLEALGYAYKCKEYQNSDEGLLIVSSQIGLLSERPESIGAYITRGALAELIARALTIDMCIMEYTSSGGHKFTVAEGRNLLNSVHGIYEVGGFVNAIPGLAVYGGTSVREGYIQIDRRNVYANGLDLDKYLGSRVTAFATFDEDTKIYSIIYMDYAEDYQALEIDFRDIVDFKNGVITYVNDENVELETDVSDLSYVIENGKVLSSIDMMCDYKDNEGKIILTASEKKGEPDTAIIYRYNYYVASYADANQYRVGLNFRQEYDGVNYIQLGEKDIIKVTVDGEASSYDKIPSGASFRFFRCDTSGYTEIVAVTTKVTGAVEGMGDNVVTIAENSYILTQDLLKHIEYCNTSNKVPASQKIKALEAGVTTTFYVFDDKIVCYSGTQEYVYGFLKSVSMARTSIDPDLTFRIFSQDGEWVDLVVNQPIEVDGEAKVSKENLLAKINSNMDIINNAVRYKANGSGELLALDTIEYNLTYEDDVYGALGKITPFSQIFKGDWTRDYMGPGAEYLISPSTVIFIAPEPKNGGNEVNEDEVRIISNTQVKGNMNLNVYSYDDYNQITLAVVKEAVDTSGGGGVGSFYYVEGIRRTIVDKDNFKFGYKIIAKKLTCKDSMVHTERTGYLEDVSLAVAEDVFDKNDEDENDEQLRIDVGDVIRASVTGGEITGWDMFLKDGKINDEYYSSVINSKDSAQEVFARGNILAINPASRNILLKADGKIIPAFMALTAVIDTVNNKIEIVSAEDFTPGVDKVATYIRYGRMTFMFKNK